MYTVSIKRKNDDELLAETANPRKRLKIEEIVFGKVLSEEKNVSCITEKEDQSTKRKSKLLAALNSKKKYKYYCKKHNQNYLIESVRKKVREFSKEKRSNLIQSFRFLNVSNDLDKISEHSNNSQAFEIKHNLKRNQCDYGDDSDIDDNNQIHYKRPKLPPAESLNDLTAEKDIAIELDEESEKHKNLTTKKIIDPELDEESELNKYRKYKAEQLKKLNRNKRLKERKYHAINEMDEYDLTSDDDDDETSELFDYKSLIPKKSNLKEGSTFEPYEKFKLNHIIDDDGNSVNSDDYEKVSFKKPKKRKTFKYFIVRKNPGDSNVVFSEREDYIDSDYIDEKNCDCAYYEDLKTKFHNYKYESSSEQDSDIFSEDDSYTR